MLMLTELTHGSFQAFAFNSTEQLLEKPFHDNYFYDPKCKEQLMQLSFAHICCRLPRPWIQRDSRE